MTNIVYIATSLDGYIADASGGLDWLNAVPNPEQVDMGYREFIERIDALVMGRNTFETVIGFDCDWPYTKPVFVLSRTLKSIPDTHRDKAFLVSGELSDVLEQIHAKGYKDLYIDGGNVIQQFLREGRIDEMILTRMPVLLGGGVPLFGDTPEEQHFQHIKTEVFLDSIVQSRYLRKR